MNKADFKCLLAHLDMTQEAFIKTDIAKELGIDNALLADLNAERVELSKETTARLREKFPEEMAKI